MDLKLLRDVIEKRKGKRIIIEDFGGENDSIEPKQEMTSEKQKEPDDDGLAPDVKVNSKEVESDSGDAAELSDVLALEAEEVLGRKPMSTVMSDNQGDDMGMDEADLDQDVLKHMTDERLIEQLKKGKTPSSLGDRVQANISKLKSRIKAKSKV